MITVLRTVLALWLWQTSTDASCTKFTSNSNLAASVVVNGICYYGFSVGYQYNNAETLCTSEGTRLPIFELESKQLDVYSALGSQFGQHWIGLKFVSGSWQWWDSGTGTTMTSPRWDGGSSGQCAYTQNSNMGGKWKAANLNHWYRPVCEDGSASIPTTTPSTTSSTSTTPVVTTTSSTTLSTTSTPIVTTTLSPTTTPTVTTTTADILTPNCNKNYDETSDGIMSAEFSKGPYFASVNQTTNRTGKSKLACAVLCMASPTCCSFAFNKLTRSCQHYESVPTGSDVICSSTDKCYFIV